ncbi:hypothetical protein IAU60_000927 [Kwoniella sp. DSM 27419]
MFRVTPPRPSSSSGPLPQSDTNGSRGRERRMEQNGGSSSGTPREAKRHKVSLDFLLSPTTSPQSTSAATFPSPGVRTASSTRSVSPRLIPSSTGSALDASTAWTPRSDEAEEAASPTLHRDSAHHKTLSALPRDLLASIAYHVLVDDRGQAGHPAELLPLFLTSKAIYEAISFDNNPQLYHRLFRATFDHAALTRRYLWMKANLAKGPPGQQKKAFDLFADPRSWAIDYRTRWEMSWRLRQVGKHGTIDLAGVCDRGAFVADLWNIWFLLTENDGKNIEWINRNFDLRACLKAYHKDNLLKESLVPGYPRETGDKALATWIGLMVGADDIGEDSPEDVDEKIFMLRPYVFACAKYDVTYAPWHYRRLPFCPPNCTEHEPDESIRSKALTYKRFGYTWKRAPPHFVLGIFLAFLRLLERQPDRVGLKAGSSTFSQPSFKSNLPGLFSVNKPILSIQHDREWQRNSMCQDPHTSYGLPPLSFRGMMEGFWRGKFLFYDFELYRQILAGNMRGVYTGTFAEQAAEMEIKETVIKLPKEQVGGNGPLLFAGYTDFKDDLDDVEQEQRRIRDGYGYELCADDEVVPEGWTKEILLSGRCRTAWGWASIRGRIRAWDGLVIFDMTYARHVMGRWLWRGYLHTGGYLVGRWRDTFTAESLRGYEGAFGMIRAGDPVYPDHFPTRMEDSLGVNQTGHPGPTPPGTAALPGITAPAQTAQAVHTPGGHGPPAHVHAVPAMQRVDGRTSAGGSTNGSGPSPR